MENQHQTLTQQITKEISGQEEPLPNRRNEKKIRMTIYLTEEAEYALTELYIHRLRKNRKIDRSIIACEAILELYEKECACVSGP